DVTIKTSRGEQTITIWGDSYANARAGLLFVNSSVGAENNKGATGMPATFSLSSFPSAPWDDTYSTYYGVPGYPLDPKTGYPLNVAPAGKTIRRLAVGYRTGDHTGSSVPVTAEGPGAFLFTGYQDQTDLFFKMAVSLTGDTADGDKFVDEVLKNSK